MLCIISDLHLTDGTSGETISGDAFRIFTESLKDRALDACWRADGQFKPIDRCDLVLLGDIFDIIRSEKWLDQTDDKLRPWGNLDAIAPIVEEITDGIIKKNSEGLAYIKNLGNVLELSDPGGASIKIPFQVHYLVGNHDWFYYVSNSTYSNLRKKVIDALGLDNDPNKSFPHMLSDDSAAVVASLFNKHRVYGQHGDIYDVFNYEKERGRADSSLGDCLVIELLDCFPKRVQLQLGLSSDDAVIKALREIDNVRPLMSIPSWLDSRLRSFPKIENQVKDVWNGMVDNFLEIPFVKEHDTWSPLDPVDAFKVGLKLSKTASITDFTRWSVITNQLDSLFGGDNYVSNAMNEKALAKIADYVVYGHTHKPETVFLTSTADTEKIYFNSGTWRRVHAPCIKNPKAEFANFHVMTYIIFYTDGERKGRRYETWNGQLG